MEEEDEWQADRNQLRKLRVLMNVSALKKRILGQLNKKNARLDEIVVNSMQKLPLVSTSFIILFVKVQARVGHTNIHRRSHYIGVQRNGKNWQVLLTIRRKKRYISTCKT